MIFKEYKNKELPLNSDKHSKWNKKGFYQYKPINSVIGLCGISRKGKSATLKMLIDLLIQKAGGSSNFSNQKGDFRVLITYRNTRILICTAGDTREILEMNCRLFEEVQPDICISAVNMSNACMQAFDYYANKMLDMTSLLMKIRKEDLCKDNLENIDNDSNVCNHKNMIAAKLLLSIIDNVIDTCTYQSSVRHRKVK